MASAERSVAIDGRADGPTRHRPWLAAVLSFIFPGLGQAYAGKWRPAFVFAVPVVLLLTTALLLVGVLRDSVRNGLLSSDFLTGVLVVNVLLLLWRSLAILHAGLGAPPIARGARQPALAAVVVLLALTVAMHVWAGVVVAHLNGTLSEVFGPPPPTGIAIPTEGPSQSLDPGAEPINPPDYRWDGTERVNVLLIGTDQAPGRERTLTDVILGISIDPVEGTAVMVSVPRDTGYLPLPDDSVYPDGLYPGKANALAAEAEADPATWCPDLDITPEQCGIRTLERSVGLLMGIEIHHYATVDMAGFAGLIDALGGVQLCLPGRLVDPAFDGTLTNEGDQTLVLPAGCHHYDGIDALAYARSRQGWIEMPDGTRDQQTDFDRNERQQLVLLALRNEMADADLIFELPGVLSAISQTVSTDFPRDQAGDLASLLPIIAGPDIERVVLSVPEFADPPVDPQNNYLLIPRRDAIRQEMARIFGSDALRGWYLAGDAPAPGATPEVSPP
jgi:polyisoprenyl-teichoic acid--peptidoglycan teichoic acid transferase